MDCLAEIDSVVPQVPVSSTPMSPRDSSSVLRLPASLDDHRRCEALLLHGCFDLADFEVKICSLQQPSPWPDVRAFVTIACRRARVSRTYAVAMTSLAWMSQLRDDLQAGVFGGATTHTD